MVTDIVPDPEIFADVDADDSEAGRLVKQGLAKEQRGLLIAAINDYAAALAVDRDHPEALRGLARTAFEVNDSAAAEIILRASIERRPDDAGLYALLAKALAAMGQQDEATAQMEKGIAIGARDRGEWADISEAALATGLYQAFSDRLDAVDASPPTHAGDDMRISISLGLMNLPWAAIRYASQAIDQQPERSDFQANASVYYHLAGHVETASDLIDKAIGIEGRSRYLQRRVFISYFDPAVTEQMLANFMRNSSELVSLKHKHEQVGWRVRPDPDRKLRIGYVGADFRNHSNGFAFAPLFNGWNAVDFELVVYNVTERKDFVSGFFRQSISSWRDAYQLNDLQLARQIRADRIDILVDLISHTAGSRLNTFRHRPAPIQVEWNNASGIPEMDWLLTDAVQWPAHTDGLLPEKPWRLDCVAMPFLRAEDFPDAPDPDDRPDRPFTFAFFNNLIKINDGYLDVLGGILRRAPAARLLMKFYTFDDPAVGADVRQRFADRGVDPDRIACRGRTGRTTHLQAYAETDVALDPFPGNGGVTTWESLCVGVPVVGLLGDRPNGRMTASILQELRLDWLVTETPQAYEDLAVALATDPALARRANVELRHALKTAKIFEAGHYVGKVEAAYRDMWRRWCADQQAGMAR